jgi:hypothetical protein
MKRRISGFVIPFYFSFVSGNAVFIDRLLVENREFNASRMFPSVLFAGELPCDVVETRPEMMDDFTCNYTEAEWDRTIFMVVNSLKEQLLVVLGQDGVFAFLKKTGDFRLQIADTLVGPF